MRITRGRRARSPESADGPSTKRAKKKKAEASFGKLPQELQKTILQMFYREPGINLREQIKRLGTVRLICRCTNEWARLALTSHVVDREVERRQAFEAELASSSIATVAKALLSKDTCMSLLFNTLVKDTDGRNAFKGVRLMGKLFAKEEKWLRKCHVHTAAGNETLEGVQPDPDSDDED